MADTHTHKEHEHAAAPAAAPAAAQAKEKIPAQKPAAQKNEATVRATVPVSKKYSAALCRFIKGKTIAQAIQTVEGIQSMKHALPYFGEVGHKKSTMSGKYPQKVSFEFLRLLKNLRANATALGVDVVHARVTGKADVAPRRKFGMYKGKNTHILLSAALPAAARKS